MVKILLCVMREAVEEDIHIEAKEQSHYLAIELKTIKVYRKRTSDRCPLFDWNCLKMFLKFSVEVSAGKIRIV